MAMTILIASGVLLVAWLSLVLFSHGYVNTCEWLAWRVKLHADRVRAMHERRANVMRDRWVVASASWARETAGEE